MRVPTFRQSYQERFPGPGWEEKQEQDWLRCCITFGPFEDQAFHFSLMLLFSITITVVITHDIHLTLQMILSKSMEPYMKLFTVALDGLKYWNTI
jgi:hypothetical protein